MSNFLHKFNPKHMLDEPRAYIGSSGIGLCQRKAYYSCAWARGLSGVGEPEAAELTGQIRMNRGTLLEPLVIDILKASGYVLEKTGKDQMTTKTTWGTEGHPDGMIVEDPDDPECAGWILEVKTVGTMKFVTREGPSLWNMSQAADYVFATGAGGVKFVYLESSWGKIERFLVTAEQLAPYALENEATASNIKDALIDNNPSLAPCTPKSWECGYCGFRNQCDGKD